MSKRRGPETPISAGKRSSFKSPSRGVVSSPAVVSSAGASLAADHGTFKLNATYLAELDIAWQKVNKHLVFQVLAKLSTPPIGMEGLDVVKFT
jgi:hypothetical protein